MWCESGVECIQDITDNHPDNWGKSELLETLRGVKPKTNPLYAQVNMMIMRAHVNIQRHYEIYWFTASDSMTKECIDDWFDTDCQSAVDWIRINGTHVYGRTRGVHRPAIV